MSDDVEIIAVNIVCKKRVSDVERLEAMEPLPAKRGKLARDCSLAVKEKTKPKKTNAKPGKPKQTKAPSSTTKKSVKTKSSCSSIVPAAASSTTSTAIVAATGEGSKGLQMTAKCIKSRAYHGAARLAKSLGKSEEEQKDAARKAFSEAAARCASEGIR